jgi:two-component system, OmpR family, sensor kinase
VPADAQARIYDRFYRVDVEPVRRGSGLGLAVVKAVGEAHGGFVSLDSEPGRTVFGIHIPTVAAVTPSPEPRSRAAHAAPQPSA